MRVGLFFTSKPVVVRKKPPGVFSNALTAWHSAKKCVGCVRNCLTSATTAGFARADVTL